jgi:5,6-dimethylbenzimidazole synthase
MDAGSHGLYDVILARRDVRRFRTDPVPDAVLWRILQAAHHAPSVGFMQPWNFIVVRDHEVKTQVKQAFVEENTRAARRYRGQRRVLYDSLKLEGILEAPINLCVTCDRSRFGPHVLGRNSLPETDLFSTCCAIQNLWLAACAESLGVGWVSILRVEQLRRILGIPKRIAVVAWLCVGYPQVRLPKPELELVGWAPRLPLGELIFRDRWGRRHEELAAMNAGYAELNNEERLVPSC